MCYVGNIDTCLTNCGQWPNNQIWQEMHLHWSMVQVNGRFKWCIRGQVNDIRKIGRGFWSLSKRVGGEETFKIITTKINHKIYDYPGNFFFFFNTTTSYFITHLKIDKRKKGGETMGLVGGRPFVTSNVVRTPDDRFHIISVYVFFTGRTYFWSEFYDNIYVVVGRWVKLVTSQCWLGCQQ